jgi:hypothetical protein
MARKLVTKLKKIWVWDLRSRKSNPGSGSRLDPDPGWIRIQAGSGFATMGLQ